jgi:hypothetical protein
MHTRQSERKGDRTECRQNQEEKDILQKSAESGIWLLSVNLRRNSWFDLFPVEGSFLHFI